MNVDFATFSFHEPIDGSSFDCADTLVTKARLTAAKTSRFFMIIAPGVSKDRTDQQPESHRPRPRSHGPRPGSHFSVAASMCVNLVLIDLAVLHDEGDA